MELTGLDWSAHEMEERLTLCGTACEEVEPTAMYMDKVVVGVVLDLQPIEGADKIRKVLVDIGGEKLDVVCGAPNVAVGQRVPVALVGARLAGGFEIKKAKIRGVESRGMICSEMELGISADHSGIMVLEPDANPGTPLVEHLGYDDYILSFELTPNRADSMSAIGIARDLAALASTRVRLPAFELKESNENAADHISVTIENPDACPRFTARIIRKIRIGPSPWWLQKKLLTAGMRPISNIVDVTNLVMLETGNPLHAFDLDKFGSDEVVVRLAREAEKLVSLDGNEHTLTPDVLLVTNGKRPLAAAGVMGGLDSEVSETTTNILLEVAYFNPSIIRRSRKHLGLVTEASTRFEKGVDPGNVACASARAAYLFHELCGGEVLRGVVDCYPNPIRPSVVSFRPGRCNYVLGTDFSPQRMSEILSGLEFGVEGRDPMQVTVPTFRPDITREIDLIEEVASIEGYDAIPDAVANIGPLFTPIHTEELFAEGVRRVLTAAGFDEMIGHGLADSRQASVLEPDLPQLRIVNPISEDLNIMRNSLVLSGLTAVAHNIAHRNLDLRLFEIGKAYFPPDPSGDWREEDRLMLLLSGNSPSNWRDEPRPFDFYDLTGALERLASHFHWPGLQYNDESYTYLDDAVSYRINVRDASVGVIGRISVDVAQKLNIKQPVYVAEMIIPLLIDISRDLVEFTPPPVYPAAPRDLALIVDESVRVGEIVSKITAVAGQLAEAVEIFDLYSGKQTGEGKKSVGVAITYRSQERSLASEEVDSIQRDIMDMLKRDFRAQIREK